jgi:hypothetical protein
MSVNNNQYYKIDETWTLKKQTIGFFSDPKNRTLFVLAIFTVASLVCNTIVYRVQLVPMKNYPLFITWLMALGYNFLYFPILLTRYKMGIVTPEMLEHAKSVKWRFLGMGVCDACGQIAQIFSARYISGYLLTLLSQGNIPMTILISLVLTKAKYSLGQLVGAAILMSGTAVAISPQFSGHGSAILGWAILYFCSYAFNATSFLLKESIFSSAEDGPGMDIFVINSFGSFFQLLFTCVSLPIVLLPGFGSVTIDHLPTYLRDSAMCWTGVAPNAMEDCSGMPWLGLMYIAVNLTLNILFLTLIKKGGALMGFITGATAFPLSHMAFALPWPRLPASPIEWTDLVALALCLTGLVTYRYFTYLKLKAAQKA